jgi:hypothetical protein
MNKDDDSFYQYALGLKKQSEDPFSGGDFFFIVMHRGEAEAFMISRITMEICKDSEALAANIGSTALLYINKLRREVRR